MRVSLNHKAQWLDLHKEPFIFIKDGMEQGCPCIIVRLSIVVALNK